MKQSKLFAVAVLAAALASFSACVAYPYGSMHDWGMHGWGYGAFVAWMLFILVVVVIAYVVYKLFSGAHPRSPMETPLEILKRRYARGEITKEEFERMRRDLLE